MKYKRNIGVILLVGAFVFAAAGNAARGLSGESGIFGILGTKQVLEILAPTFLSSLAGFIQNYLHPLIWDPFLLGILAFPGWFLIGLPGAILVWKYRQIPVGGEATKEELAYNTYEYVLAAAKEAELENSEEPSRYKPLQEYDPLNPPDDRVQYGAFLEQPGGASDLADFRNEIIDMPSDVDIPSEVHYEQKVLSGKAQEQISPEPNFVPSPENKSKPIPNDDHDK